MRNNKQKPIRLLASFLAAMLVALLLPQAAMAQHTTTHRNVESGSASTTTETKKADSSSSKSKKQSSAKKEKKKKSQEPVTYQREEEDKLPANYQGGFHFGDMTHVSGTAGNRTSTDTPAHLFVVRPMAIANGLTLPDDLAATIESLDDEQAVPINVAGDYVEHKHIEKEVANVEAGGVGFETKPNKPNATRRNG